MLLLKIFFINCLFFFFSINFCLSASYYVDATNGNDTNTGLSHAQAWKTLGKIGRFSFNNGDDVYLLCGAKWVGQQIVVHWSGSASNPVIIGSYYMEGSEIKGVNGNGRPIIDGANTYPTDTFGALVKVDNSADYVTLQDLHLKRSHRRGIGFGSGTDRGTVKRCKVNETKLENLYFAGGHDYALIEYCELSNGGKTRVDDYLGACNGWPVAGIRLSGSTHATIRYNWVYDQYAEAIMPGRAATCIYNLVGDSMSVAIYVSSTYDTEVAYNIVYGTDSTKFNNIPNCSSSQGDWKGNGITFGHEVYTSYSDVDNVKIHHNIVINRMSGIRAYNSNSDATITSAYIYNNHLIDNKYNFWVSNNNDKSDGAVSVRNNISYPMHPDSSHLYSDKGLDKWTMNHNLWAIKPAPKGEWSGIGDLTTDPGFPRSKWKDYIEGISDIKVSDMITKDLPANLGANLGTDYVNSIDPDASIAVQNQNVPIIIKTTSTDEPIEWSMGALLSNNSGTSNFSCKLCPPKGIIAH